MVTFPWNVPLNGACVCAAAGRASAAVRIIPAMGRYILVLVMVFICAFISFQVFRSGAGSNPALRPLVQTETSGDSGHGFGIFLLFEGEGAGHRRNLC